MTDDELIAALRDEAVQLSGQAWRRSDGGQDCSIAANLADQAADRLAALAGDCERLRAALGGEVPPAGRHGNTYTTYANVLPETLKLLDALARARTACGA